MLFRKLLLGLVLAFACTVAASAQTATPKVKDRQVNQAKRINQGVKSGELTKGETVQAVKQQKRINKSKKAAKADGKVTKKERAKLHARQNAASRNIKRKKNN